MKPCTIHLNGSIQHVLFSRVGAGCLTKRSAQEAGFSFGLGALTVTAEQGLRHLGELLTLPGLTAIVEADTPDHPTLSATNGRSLYTPFNVIVEGLSGAPLQELHSGHAGSMRADQLFIHSAITLRDSGDHPPLLAGVYWARIESFRGAYLKQNPVEASAPDAGLAINDPRVHSQWFGVDPDGGWQGLTAIVVGVALDPSSPKLSTLQGAERHIFYGNPGTPYDEGVLAVHQHGVVMRGVEPPPPGTDVLDAVERTLTLGEVVDVKHVLEDSVFGEVVGLVRGAEEIVSVERE